MHNAVEKTFENRWKKGMIGQTNNQTFASDLADDFKCVQYE
jgi:hypothetical protein